MSGYSTVNIIKGRRGDQATASIDVAVSATDQVISEIKNIEAGDARDFQVFAEVSASPQRQVITPSAAPDAGTFTISYGGATTSALAHDASAATIQTAVRTLTGLSAATVSGTMATAVTIVATGATALVTAASSLTNGGSGVTLSIAGTVAGTMKLQHCHRKDGTFVDVSGVSLAISSAGAKALSYTELQDAEPLYPHVRVTMSTTSSQAIVIDRLFCSRRP